MAVRLNIKIGGVNVDLPPDIDNTFFVTRQIHDILKGLQTREGDFTRSIALPNSAKNAVLTNGIIPVNFNRRENDLIKCTVLMDGVTVINDGKLLVTKVTKHVINCNIFGGNTNFFSQLKDDYLSALNLSAYNFTYDGPGLTPIINNTSGVVWANSLFTTNQSYREFIERAPAGEMGAEYFNFQWGGVWFYIDTLLEVIFNQLTGLTVDRSALDSQFIKNAIAIPLPQILKGFGVPPGYRGFGSNSNNIDYGPGITALIPDVFQDPDLIWNGNEWIIQDSGLCVVRVLMVGIGSTPDVTTRPTVEVLKNGTKIGEAVINVGYNFPAQFQTSILTSANCNPGDAILIRTVNPNNSTYSTQYFSHSVEKGGAGSGGGSREINISDYMPPISQKSFVLNCFKQYNIVANEVNGVIKLSYWDDILTKPPALITDFANEDREGTTLTPAYGQTNILEYAENDLIERLDTSASFPVNSDYLESDKVIIKLVFSDCDENEATLNDSNLTALPHYFYEYYKIENNKINITGAATYNTTEGSDLKPGDIIRVLGTPDFYQVDQVTDNKNGTLIAPGVVHNAQDWEFLHVEATDNGAICLASMEQTDTPLTYGDGAVFTTTIAQLRKKAVFVDALRFESILNNYFFRFQRTIQSPAIIYAWLHISVIDFVGLDQTAPIYIKSLAQNFYINKIEQFKSEGLTRFELIKI